MIWSRFTWNQINLIIIIPKSNLHEYYSISSLTFVNKNLLLSFPILWTNWRVMRNVVLFSFILLLVLIIFCANRTPKSKEPSSWIINEAQSFYHHVKYNSHSGYEHIWPVSLFFASIEFNIFYLAIYILLSLYFIYK